ncbi:MAG TPA: dethiobiotin synthase [Nitrospiraceae bacterium]|nr:dethiobiotin synthase [Nitrospiraceae bacterium]
MRRTGQSTHTGVFITGTDTAVGKTLVSAVLALQMKQQGYTVGVMKPIETGVSKARLAQSDGARLQGIVESDEALGAISPFRFELPLTPLAAAQAEGRQIDPAVIYKVYRLLSDRYECLVMEGVGGVHVPLAPKFAVIDLVAHLKLPAVVVGRSRLGGINHALLTVEALQRRKIPIVALVLNQTEPVRSKIDRLQERTTVEILRKKAGVPVIGPLPYRSELSRQFRRSATRLAHSAAIKKLAKVVRRAMK